MKGVLHPHAGCSQTHLVFDVLEVEDEAAVLVLVPGIDVLVQVEQLLLNVVGNGLHVTLLQILHVRCILTPEKQKLNPSRQAKSI